MSTEANAALAWPIEATEPALIGEQLIGRKKTPKQVTTFWTHLEMADGKRASGDLQGTPLELCGTSIPGNVHFKYPDEVDARTGIQFDYPEAGMWWSEAAMAWRVRPFTGDWLADPLVREEGTATGYWGITVEGEILHAGSHRDYEEPDRDHA